jgi:hypothetical protein
VNKTARQVNKTARQVRGPAENQPLNLVWLDFYRYIYGPARVLALYKRSGSIFTVILTVLLDCYRYDPQPQL